MKWTSEKSQELRQLWEAGMSYSQIAEIMGEGLSRQAIGGQCLRLGLRRPANFSCSPRIRSEREVKEISQTAYGEEGGLSLDDLRATSCRFPTLSEDTLLSPQIFCGADKKAGSSYCEKHYSITYTKHSAYRKAKRARQKSSITARAA